MDNHILRHNHKYEILTPSGYQSFAGIRKISKDVIYTIILSNNKTIKCSDNHPFIINTDIIHSNKLKVGDILDGVDDTIITIVDIKKTMGTLNLFDVVDVNGGNLFNVDGIISHNCDFITSGYGVVDGSILEWYKENHVVDPLEERGFDGNYWLWKYPDYDKNYIVVADVARGDGKDFSTFHVFDVETVEQVAEYKGKIETKPFGEMLVAVAIEWNNAMLVIENANVGWAAIQPAIDRHYENLYYSYKDFGYVDDEVHLQSAYDMADKSKMVPGFSMTTRTRPLVISKLDTYMREKVPIIHSIRLINELFVFVWMGSKAIARNGHNDDLVMAFSTALWVRDTALRLRQKGIDLNRSAIQHTTKSNTFYSNTQRAQSDKYWNMNIGGKHSENIKWLL